MDVGVPELLIILAVLLLLFGSKKTPRPRPRAGSKRQGVPQGLHDSSDTAEDKPPEEQAGG